jgi:hypothetical protein
LKLIPGQYKIRELKSKAEGQSSANNIAWEELKRRERLRKQKAQRNKAKAKRRKRGR